MGIIDKCSICNCLVTDDEKHTIYAEDVIHKYCEKELESNNGFISDEQLKKETDKLR